MIKKYKDGRTVEFESVQERETRLKKIALDLYERCKSEKLTLSDYERTKIILDNIIQSRAHM